MSATDDKSSASLFGDVVSGLGRLLKGELMLARAEAADALRGAGGGLVKLGIAAILGLVGLNVLAGAAVAGLAATGMGPAMGGLIVALVLLGAALILALMARAALRLKGLLPRRAFRGLGEDGRALRAGLMGKGTLDV